MSLRDLLHLWAPLCILQFFCNDANNLVSRRGAEVLSTPALKRQVEDAIRHHNREKRSGPVVVTFTHA